MHYALVYYPQLDPRLRESVDAIRQEHDPTASFSAPHVTIIFPVPGVVGLVPLVRHIGNVLKQWTPFEVQFGGLHRSRDHWLFLTLTGGERELKEMHEAMYTGMLGKYRRDDIEYVPHLGLGLFVKGGSKYDWDNPREEDFDGDRYKRALTDARGLPLGEICIVDRLHLLSLPDALVEWTQGKRSSISEDWRPETVKEFRLVDRRD